MKFLRRIYELNNKDSSFFSLLIKRIALVSISIGLFSVIISSFVLDGFKKEIKNKIYSFSGHYNVSSYSNGLSFKYSPLNLEVGIFKNYSNLYKFKIQNAIHFFQSMITYIFLYCNNKTRK